MVQSTPYKQVTIIDGGGQARALAFAKPPAWTSPKLGPTWVERALEYRCVWVPELPV